MSFNSLKQKGYLSNGSFVYIFLAWGRNIHTQQKDDSIILTSHQWIQKMNKPFGVALHGGKYTLNLSGQLWIQ